MRLPDRPTVTVSNQSMAIRRINTGPETLHIGLDDNPSSGNGGFRREGTHHTSLFRVVYHRTLSQKTRHTCLSKKIFPVPQSTACTLLPVREFFSVGTVTLCLQPNMERLAFSFPSSASEVRAHISSLVRLL